MVVMCVDEQEKDIREHFYRFVFNTFIPLWVQSRSEVARNLFDAVLADETVKDAFADLWPKYCCEKKIIEVLVADELRIPNSKLRAAREAVYSRLIDNVRFFDEFFARPLTDGNEQCPYWDRYDVRPLRHS